MPAGNAFTATQRADLERVVAIAEQRSGLNFSVYVGPLNDGRDSAIALHSGTDHRSQDLILVAVDPEARRLEIVTGADAFLWCDDRTCGLAALTMTSSFAAGDLIGGLKNGLALLGEHSRRPNMRHIDTL